MLRDSIIPKKYHLESLKMVIDRIKDLEYFVFYGTLLGITRENDIIENDDDVDLLVNIKHREQLLEVMKDCDVKFNMGIWPNLSPYFLQGRRIIEGNKLSCVDFYLYDDSLVENHIADRWSFSGRFNEKQFSIHVPNEIVFPIRKKKFYDYEINMPSDPVKCCEFLYGKYWIKDMRKNIDYKMSIINNKPRIVYEART